MTTKPKINDKRIELIMGNLLRYGVIVSALIVIVGGAIYIWQHGRSLPQFKTFTGEPKRLTEIRSILQTALQGRGRSIVQVGLLILICTPVLRILFSVVGFIIEKDLLYTAITMIVLIIIIIGSF